jgi:hypothetical protein
MIKAWLKANLIELLMDKDVRLAMSTALVVEIKENTSPYLLHSVNSVITKKVREEIQQVEKR